MATPLRFVVKHWGLGIRHGNGVAVAVWLGLGDALGVALEG
jgi:hypothetical protein